MKQSLGVRPLIYPTPVWVVGTYGEDGKPNLMTASWAGICSSSPPCVNVSLREATSTYKNIIARKAFTLSVPSESQAKIADWLGMSTGAKVDKFELTGLTPVKADLINAPYAAEFPMVLECVLSHTLPLGLHTMFVGEIADVKCDESKLGPTGLPDLEKIKPFLFAPEVRGYYRTAGFLGEAFSIGRSVAPK